MGARVALGSRPAGDILKLAARTGTAPRSWSLTQGGSDCCACVADQRTSPSASGPAENSSAGWGVTTEELPAGHVVATSEAVCYPRTTKHLEAMLLAAYNYAMS